MIPNVGDTVKILPPFHNFMPHLYLVAEVFQTEDDQTSLRLSELDGTPIEWTFSPIYVEVV